MSNPFENLVGNEVIKDSLTRVIENQTIPNSLLFYGPQGVGKGLFAKAFAMAILKTDKASHPDLYEYNPQAKIGMHTIDTMREFSEQVYLAPYNSSYKVFIIHEADRMLPSSANALLKTFEEPSSDAIIILTTSAKESILPTVLSRCCAIAFQTIPEETLAQELQQKYSVPIEQAAVIAKRSRGSMSQALTFLEEDSHSIRKTLLSVLSRGKFASYSALLECVQKISTEIDQMVSHSEQLLRQELMKQFAETLTSSQSYALEQEIAGAVAMKRKEQADALLNEVLAWYRDLTLLHFNGKASYLMHFDYYNALIQRVQKGNIVPLEQVQEMVYETQTALQRSTSLNICLENLFLRLGLI